MKKTTDQNPPKIKLLKKKKLQKEWKENRKEVLMTAFPKTLIHLKTNLLFLFEAKSLPWWE